ncbi:MAG: LLM class F420-dependent oxidoreductase [Myxococcota bacterium]|nr:LLM class F420-dependent oxidoreductase [Myxococcota bacterium]
MKIGVTIHATDLAISPVELAREAEARGFHSLYIPEHTHIPTSRRTPPPTGDAELAEEYSRSPDPYICLAAAASVTERIELGTGIGLPAQHDHITFAKQISTLDVVSAGRLVLGIGYGWNHEEMENHGIEVKTRRDLVREKILAMRALWTHEVAEFHGQWIDMEPSWQWPKPVQQPGPPILIGGGAGPKLFAHIAEFADGWMPIGGSGMRESLSRLREAMSERQRDPASLRIVPMGVLPDEKKLAYYRDSGATEAILRLPSGSRDVVLPRLDEFARYLELF